MSKYKTKSLATSTTRVVNDRFAKIAAAYTRGFVKVRYIADRICTDQVEVITLPQTIEEADEDTIELAWGYLNHEMGHIEVQRVLDQAKKSEIPAQRFSSDHSEKLFNLIPASVQEAGKRPGTKIETPVDMLNGIKSRCRCFEVKFGTRASLVARQLKELVNCTEDPRMEAQVAKRWAGTEGHLLAAREYATVQWRERAKEMIDERTDGAFFQFGCAIAFYLSGVDVEFMGTRTLTQLNAVRDILDVYLDEWNAEHSQGFYDAWNAAVAILARCYGALSGLGVPEELMSDMGEGKSDESDESDESSKQAAPDGDPIRVGDRVRVKKTGEIAVVQSVYEDGSIEAMPEGGEE